MFSHTPIEFRDKALKQAVTASFQILICSTFMITSFLFLSSPFSSFSSSVSHPLFSFQFAFSSLFYSDFPISPQILSPRVTSFHSLSKSYSSSLHRLLFGTAVFPGTRWLEGEANKSPPSSSANLRQRRPFFMECTMITRQIHFYALFTRNIQLNA